jgi:hypothetical protein
LDTGVRPFGLLSPGLRAAIGGVLRSATAGIALKISTFLSFSCGLALGVWCLSACDGSEEPSERPADGGGNSASCEDLPDYFAGMEASGEGGITVKLLDSQPAPPVPRGHHTWTIELRDAAGTPVDGATIVAHPWMEVHQHGETPPAVTPRGGGRYELSPVYFRMPGPWEVRFNVTLADQISDLPVITLCIQR